MNGNNFDWEMESFMVGRMEPDEPQLHLDLRTADKRIELESVGDNIYRIKSTSFEEMNKDSAIPEMYCIRSRRFPKQEPYEITSTVEDEENDDKTNSSLDSFNESLHVSLNADNSPIHVKTEPSEAIADVESGSQTGQFLFNALVDYSKPIEAPKVLYDKRSKKISKFQESGSNKENSTPRVEATSSTVSNNRKRQAVPASNTDEETVAKKGPGSYNLRVRNDLMKCKNPLPAYKLKSNSQIPIIIIPLSPSNYSKAKNRAAIKIFDNRDKSNETQTVKKAQTQYTRKTTQREKLGTKQPEYEKEGEDAAQHPSSTTSNEPEMGKTDAKLLRVQPDRKTKSNHQFMEKE